MDRDEQIRQVLVELRAINKELALQNSKGHTLFVGVVYGVGFFIGSAIIATIAFGILGPFIGRIPWVRHSYEVGNQLRQQQAPTSTLQY